MSSSIGSFYVGSVQNRWRLNFRRYPQCVQWIKTNRKWSFKNDAFLRTMLSAKLLAQRCSQPLGHLTRTQGTRNSTRVAWNETPPHCWVSNLNFQITFLFPFDVNLFRWHREHKVAETPQELLETKPPHCWVSNLNFQITFLFPFNVNLFRWHRVLVYYDDITKGILFWSSELYQTADAKPYIIIMSIPGTYIMCVSDSWHI